MPAVCDFERGGGLESPPDSALVDEAAGAGTVLEMNPVGAGFEAPEPSPPVMRLAESEGSADTAPVELAMSAAPVVAMSVLSETGTETSGPEDVSLDSTLTEGVLVAAAVVPPIIPGSDSTSVALVESGTPAEIPVDGSTEKTTDEGNPVMTPVVGFASVSLAGMRVIWLLAKPDVPDAPAVGPFPIVVPPTEGSNTEKATVGSEIWVDIPEANVIGTFTTVELPEMGPVGIT